jgi:hypothetical protein
MQRKVLAKDPDNAQALATFLLDLLEHPRRYRRSSQVWKQLNAMDELERGRRPLEGVSEDQNPLGIYRTNSAIGAAQGLTEKADEKARPNSGANSQLFTGHHPSPHPTADIQVRRAPNSPLSCTSRNGKRPYTRGPTACGGVVAFGSALGGGRGRSPRRPPAGPALRFRRGSSHAANAMRKAPKLAEPASYSQCSVGRSW